MLIFEPILMQVISLSWKNPYIYVYVKTAAKLFEHLRYFVSKNSYEMQFYEINNYQIMIFNLYINYKKHEMMKTDNQTSEKSQVLSQVLE